MAGFRGSCCGTLARSCTTSCHPCIPKTSACPRWKLQSRSNNKFTFLPLQYIPLLRWTPASSRLRHTTAPSPAHKTLQQKTPCPHHHLHLPPRPILPTTKHKTNPHPPQPPYSNASTNQRSLPPRSRTLARVLVLLIIFGALSMCIRQVLCQGYVFILPFSAQPWNHSIDNS
jgi:hypothetical protein